jgi:hypothetical protein
MTTKVTVNGMDYNIPSDKVHVILEMLNTYKVTENKQREVREVLTNYPFPEGKTLING